MEGEEADNESQGQWTIEKEVKVEGGEEIGSNEGPLLVAMQPGTDVPAVDHVEVVVMTNENGEEEVVTTQDFVNLIEDRTGEVFSVGAVEEVTEEHIKEVVRRVLSDNNKVQASPHPAPQQHHQRAAPPRPNKGKKRKLLAEPSSSESSLDEDSDSEDETPSRSKKTPKKREFSYRLQWKDKDMLEAMKAVTEKQMTIRGAAKAFHVPYSTLKDRIHGRVAHGTKPGVKTALSPEEEEELVKYIRDMEMAGFQLRCLDVRQRAKEILQMHHGHNSPYKDCRPGHNWLAGFLKRHPGLEFKKAMNRSVVPCIPKQKAMCKRFFEITAQIYKKHRLNYKPERIYCMAEMRVTTFIDATILVCASAEGEMLPPFVIFKGPRQKINAVKQAFPDAFFTSNQDGIVHDAALMWWLRDHFLRKIPSSNHRPCVLFLSRAVHEMTFQFSQLAREERVHLISMPVGVAHILNPLDEELASSLENSIEKKARKYETENPGAPFSQKAFAHILQKVWKKYIPKRDIVVKFGANGVFPVNPNVVTHDRIAAAAAVLRDTQQSPTSDDYGGSNRDFSGLSLLSALSSQEYATIEHMYDRGESSHVNNETAERHEIKDGRVVVKVNKRMKVDEEEEEEEEEEVEEVQVSSPPSRRRSIARGDEAFIQMPVTPKKKEKQEEPPAPSIHEEIVAAKDNIDQINRAIASIGGEDYITTDGDIVIEEATEIAEDDKGTVYTEVITEEVPLEENVEYAENIQYAEDVQYTELGEIEGEVVTMDPAQVLEEVVQDDMQVIHESVHENVQEEVVTQELDHGQVYLDENGAMPEKVIFRDEEGNYIEEQVISGEYVDHAQVETLLEQTNDQEYYEIPQEQEIQVPTEGGVHQISPELLQTIMEQVNHPNAEAATGVTNVINLSSLQQQEIQHQIQQPQIHHQPQIQYQIQSPRVVHKKPKATPRIILPQQNQLQQQQVRTVKQIVPKPATQTISLTNQIRTGATGGRTKVIKLVQPKGVTLTTEQIQQIMQQAQDVIFD